MNKATKAIQFESDEDTYDFHTEYFEWVNMRTEFFLKENFNE